jgi:uncharacterized membrane protein YeaQ/YmgE (transglycosylase-associated protein family)
MLQRNILFRRTLYRIDAPAALMLNGLWPWPAAGSIAACGSPRRHAGGGIAIMMLETNSIIVILVIGLVAGWLAGRIMGGGFGIIGDIILGIIGAFIGTWLWGTLHLPMIANFWISAIVISTVGACILLFIIRLIKR